MVSFMPFHLTSKKSIINSINFTIKLVQGNDHYNTESVSVDIFSVGVDKLLLIVDFFRWNTD